MMSSHTLRRSVWLLVGCSIGFILRSAATGSQDPNDVAAVSSKVSRDYVRTKLPDGLFQPEYYAFGKGGAWSSANADASIDKLSFWDVARTLAAPLASENYVSTKDPSAARLLIMVYWGKTRTPEDAGLGDQLVELTQISPIGLDAAISAAKIVEKDDKLNALMLGYDSWWDATQGDHRGTALGLRRQDLIDEMEQNRYFVVLMAYDFQLLWKEKKHKLLWETRFSIRERNHQFDRDLPSMAQYASQYFGQDSHGLVRKPIPEGDVNIGEVKALGEVQEPKK